MPKKVFLSPECERLLLKIPPAQVGMFRFLLEARENLAMFTVLNRDLALLKLMYAPESRSQIIKALEEIKKELPLSYQAWPGL